MISYVRRETKNIIPYHTYGTGMISYHNPNIRSWNPPWGGPRRVARVLQDVGRPESPVASPGGAYKAQEVPGRAPRTCSKGPKRCPEATVQNRAKLMFTGGEPNQVYKPRNEISDTETNE